jgi:hypothetical protein
MILKDCLRYFAKNLMSKNIQHKYKTTVKKGIKLTGSVRINVGPVACWLPSPLVEFTPLLLFRKKRNKCHEYNAEKLSGCSFLVVVSLHAQLDKVAARLKRTN